MSEVPAPARGSALDDDFEEFVHRCSGSLFRAALLLTGERGRAEDLLQAAMLRTARRWSAARAAPEPYARRVLVNLARDNRRQAGRRVREAPLDAIDALPGSGDSAQRLSERDAMLAALRQLPLRQREVVVLRYYLDLSVAETAEALGCSEGSVKSYSARAISRLRTLLCDPPSTITSSAEVSRDA